MPDDKYDKILEDEHKKQYPNGRAALLKKEQDRENIERSKKIQEMSETKTENKD